MFGKVLRGPREASKAESHQVKSHTRRRERRSATLLSIGFPFVLLLPPLSLLLWFLLLLLLSVSRFDFLDLLGLLCRRFYEGGGGPKVISERRVKEVRGRELGVSLAKVCEKEVSHIHSHANFEGLEGRRMFLLDSLSKHAAFECRFVDQHIGAKSSTNQELGRSCVTRVHKLPPVGVVNNEAPRVRAVDYWYIDELIKDQSPKVELSVARCRQAIHVDRRAVEVAALEELKLAWTTRHL